MTPIFNPLKRAGKAVVGTRLIASAVAAPFEDKHTSEFPKGQDGMHWMYERAQIE